MATITITTDIAASMSQCFDLARSIEAHTASARSTHERAVAGKTSGLLALGDEVTWRGRHFGITQDLTSRITAFDPPVHFQDTMVRGAFASLVHDHTFAAIAGGTRMVDVVVYRAPFGPLGTLAEAIALTAYLRRFLTARAAFLKNTAEGKVW